MSNETVGLFWWAPLRQPRVLAREVLRSGGSWARASATGGLPLRNFGDYLSQSVTRYATGTRVEWASPEKADLYGVGSILEIALKSENRAVVWGSGLRAAGPTHLKGRDHKVIVAVRGQLTRDALDLPNDIPLGDPALLLRRTAGAAQGGQSIVVIPHFNAFGDGAARGLLRSAQSCGMTLISPTQSLDVVTNAIRSARHVLTSSLHGKIVADALGVPATLVHFGPRSEPDFKYHDYMSIWDRRARFVDFQTTLDGLSTQTVDIAGEERTAVNHRIEGILDQLVASLDGAVEVALHEVR